MLETINDYYEDIYKEQSTARIIDIHDNRIYLDRTIFYAESGGQESDLGFISLGETTPQCIMYNMKNLKIVAYCTLHTERNPLK